MAGSRPRPLSVERITFILRMMRDGLSHDYRRRYVVTVGAAGNIAGIKHGELSGEGEKLDALFAAVGIRFGPNERCRFCDYEPGGVSRAAQCRVRLARHSSCDSARDSRRFPRAQSGQTRSADRAFRVCRSGWLKTAFWGKFRWVRATCMPVLRCDSKKHTRRHARRITTFRFLTCPSKRRFNAVPSGPHSAMVLTFGNETRESSPI